MRHVSKLTTRPWQLIIHSLEKRKLARRYVDIWSGIVHPGGGLASLPRSTVSPTQPSITLEPASYFRGLDFSY